MVKKEKELGWLNEIVYEKEVVNWVNLIGFVDQLVQFEVFFDGKFWVGIVIFQRFVLGFFVFWYFFFLNVFVWCDYDIFKKKGCDFGWLLGF